MDLDRFTDGIFLERSGQITTEQRKPEALEETLTYRVRPGDTVWGIASLYHTTVPAIVKANRLSNANRIYVGEQLQIPVEKQDVSPVLHSYPVRKGDYLGKIAAKYGTSVRRLVQLNKITKPDSIYVGKGIGFRFVNSIQNKWAIKLPPTYFVLTIGIVYLLPALYGLVLVKVILLLSVRAANNFAANYRYKKQYEDSGNVQNAAYQEVKGYA